MMRVIKAGLVILSALFSALVILWMGAQTPPDHGSWSFLLFRRSLPIVVGASVLILGQGVRSVVPSIFWTIAFSVGILLGLCAVARLWNWLSLALLLLVAFPAYAAAVYRKAWLFIVLAGAFVTVWWLGIAVYALYDFLWPEQPAARGGLGIAQLCGVLFLIVGGSTLAIASLGQLGENHPSG
jgi:lysylphosphatidylglycerol synthetase-like protein (DUF2156 family)